MVNTQEKLHFDTFEAFHDWALKNEARAEWVAGDVLLCKNMPIKKIHQTLLAFLLSLIGEWNREQSLGGEVLFAPFAMKTTARPSAREPDLIYVAASQLPQLRETFLDGPAALCVEIVSPESADRDFNDKFQEYEAAGVQEYWIIDPDDHAVLFYRLAENGRYRRILPTEGIFVSEAVPGLVLRPAWLWEETLPTMREIGSFWSTHHAA
jgi:Uma2 family endonuclease